MLLFMPDEPKKPEDPVIDPAEKIEEKTVGAIIDEVDPKEPDGTKKPDDTADAEVVPLAAFLEMKNDNKEMKKALKELTDQIQAGDLSKTEITADIKALAEEFDVDPKFISKFKAAILAEATAKADKKVEDVTKPILAREEGLTKKERDQKIHEAFTKHYDAALETMPEYADIADAATIKALSLLPENAKKTFPQLIEATYGKAIVGKRTIDPIKPNGGKDDEPLDMARARQDTEYFKEVMANPTMKAEYNKRMLETGRRS